MHFIPLTAPEQAIGSTEQFVSLSPRGTSGERAGERGIPHKSASSPRPSPPAERGEGEETMRRDHERELSAWPLLLFFAALAALLVLLLRDGHHQLLHIGVFGEAGRCVELFGVEIGRASCRERV